MQLFIYPIKSLLPVEVAFAEVTNEGFRFDRQYVLVKAAPTVPTSNFLDHLTIKTFPALSLFRPTINSDWSQLTITYTPFTSSAIILRDRLYSAPVADS